MEVYHNIRNEDGIWVNNSVFTEAASHFKKYGRYCDDPQSVDPYSDYQRYWKEENRRCIEGYKTTGCYITGDHYNYLNYSPIRLTNDDESGGLEGVIKKKVRKTAASKVTMLPDFWDGDYDYFHVLNIARWGINRKVYDKLRLGVSIHPEDIETGGFHVAVAKARRKGFSFKNGSIVVNRYKREPECVSVIAAFDSSYLYPKGTTAMADSYIDHINEHTAWKRRKTIDRISHQEDAYIIKIDGVDIKKGYQSHIISVSCRDNPDAIRGKDGTLILLEEAGKFPNIVDTINSTLPTLEDGIYTTGQMVIFGTGGGDATNWEGFKEVFYSPESFGGSSSRFIRIHNDWDDGAKGSYCGFYFPDKKNKKGFIDKQGNSSIKRAKKYTDDIIEKIKETAKSVDRVKDYKMEYANKPSETFATSNTNIFPTEELEAHLRYVNAQKIWKHGVPGKLIANGRDAMQFWPDNNLTPVLNYPHKSSSNLEGAIVQYYPPHRVNGVVPDDLYIICHDPYEFDKSTNLESLGCTYVLLNPNNIVPGFKGGDLIVASYIGRPETLDKYNENLFNLAIYYNAKIGYENDRGDVLGYAKRNKHLLVYLEEEFELGWSTGLNNHLGRGYGMSMGGGAANKKVKNGDVFIKDFLNTVRTVTDKGVVVKNLHAIKDPGFLEELIAYGKGNFDRVSCFRIGMYFMKELDYTHTTSSTKTKDSVKKYMKIKLCA